LKLANLDLSLEQTIESLRYKTGGRFQERDNSFSKPVKSKSSDKTWFEESVSPNLVFSEEVGQFLYWLAVTLDLDRSIVSKCFRTVSFLTHIQRHKGKHQVIKIMKEMKLCVLRVLSGKPLLKDSVKFNRISEVGIPTRLYDLIDLIHGTPEEIRFLLSFLTISRSIFIKPTLNLSTITEEGKEFVLKPKIVKGFLHEIYRICKRNNKNYH
jgi:hypothetical protein